VERDAGDGAGQPIPSHSFAVAAPLPIGVCCGLAGAEPGGAAAAALVVGAPGTFVIVGGRPGGADALPSTILPAPGTAVVTGQTSRHTRQASPQLNFKKSSAKHTTESAR